MRYTPNHDIRHYILRNLDNNGSDRLPFVLGTSLADKEANRLEQERKENQRKPSPGLRYDSSVEIIGESKEQCVQFFKRVSGIQRTLGYAGTIRVQGQEPRVGAGALWENYGHIGIVRAIEGDTIVVDDSNWIKGKVTRHRLSINQLRGFIYN